MLLNFEIVKNLISFSVAKTKNNRYNKQIMKVENIKLAKEKRREFLEKGIGSKQR